LKNLTLLKAVQKTIMHASIEIDFSLFRIVHIQIANICNKLNRASPNFKRSFAYLQITCVFSK